MDGNQAVTDWTRRRQLAIGIGCSSRAHSDDLLRLIETCIVQIPPGSVIATLDRRASIAGIVASNLGLPLVLFPASVLANVAGTTASSSFALAKTRTASVAEASALASLGPSAHLIVPRRKGRFCTCAVASLAAADSA